MNIGGKFSKWLENTLGKREITHYEQILLSLRVFQRLALQTRKNQGLFGKRSNRDATMHKGMISLNSMHALTSISNMFSENALTV